MVRMISGTTGKHILCCWTECDRLGDTRWQAIAREPRRNLIYLFCSERHLLLWAHSQRDMGNLPTGSKGAFGPSGAVA